MVSVSFAISAFNTSASELEAFILLLEVTIWIYTIVETVFFLEPFEMSFLIHALLTDGDCVAIEF